MPAFGRSKVEQQRRGSRERQKEEDGERGQLAGCVCMGVVGSTECCVLSGLHRWCCETDSAGTARHAALLCAMGTVALPA